MAKEPISIIIPTLNEEDYIGNLLSSLVYQTYKDFEVVLVDGNSEDKTLAVAKKFKPLIPSLSIISSKKRSPAIQRNLGAKKALYERLLFLDADVILPFEFLERALSELKRTKAQVAHPFSTPITKELIDKYTYVLVNWGLDVAQHIYPLAGGWTIFSSQRVHKKIGGFNEKLARGGEDVDYVLRAAKSGFRFRILRNPKPYVAQRRTGYENRFLVAKDTLVWAILTLLFGFAKANKFSPYKSFDELKQLARKKGVLRYPRLKISLRQLRRQAAKMNQILNELPLIR